MHYQNGRPAQQGDQIINLQSGHTGILHSPNPSNTTCNGRMAPMSDMHPWVTIGDCLHLDDVKAAFAKPKPEPVEALPQAEPDPAEQDAS
jgi:hypothetical protein